VVRIRFQRLGRRNRSCFRIVVTDARVKRDGEYLEKLGQYDPVQKDAAKRCTVNAERVKHWLTKGAQLSVPVALLLRKQGVDVAVKPDKAKAAAQPPAPQPAPTAG